MTKINNNEFVLKPEYFDLTKAMYDALKIHNCKMNEKKIEIQVTIDDQTNLGLLSQINGDKIRINQILLNLFKSSIQVTKINGKIKIELSILERQDIYKDYQIQRKRSVDLEYLKNKNLSDR